MKKEIKIKWLAILVMMCLALAILPDTVPAATTVSAKTDAYFTIKNVGSGKYLNIAGNSSANNANVTLWQEDGTSGQDFQFVYNGACEAYYLVPRCAPLRAVNVEGEVAYDYANVSLWTITNHSTQAWIIEKVSNGYIFRSANNPNYVLSAVGTSNGSNINIRIYDSTNANQVWTSNALAVAGETSGGDSSTTSGNSASEITAAITNLKNTRYPEGYCWNNEYSDAEAMKLFNGKQCVGFARNVANIIFGSFPNRNVGTCSTGTIVNGWTAVRGEDVTSVEPGDIIRTENHSAIVWYLDGNNIYVAEAWGSSGNTIHYGYYNYKNATLAQIRASDKLLGVWKHPDRGLIQQDVCTTAGHNYSGWTIIKEPSCTAEGTKTRSCMVCGASEAQSIPAKGHTESDWILDREAEVKKDGCRHKECTVCHVYLIVETIPALADICFLEGHNYSDWTITKGPSCTAEGTRTRTCAVCGITETQAIAATGHTESDWIIDREAGIGIAGSKHKECTICHMVLESESIPALQQDVVIIDGVSNIRVLSRTATSIKLVWDAAEDQNIKYEIQQSVYDNWITVATTNSASCKISSLSPGTRYQFRVRAYKTIGSNRYYSEYSKVFCAVAKPAATNLSGLSSPRAGTIKVKWKKLNLCAGYEIQIAANAKFTSNKKSCIISDNSKSSKEISGLVRGKKYYVRIRTYTYDENGAKIYGKWSEVKSKVCK